MGVTIRGARLWDWKVAAGLILISFFMMLPATAAIGSTVTVDGQDAATDADGCGGGPGTAADPCNTIQAGVDAASPGDTVTVAAGQYVEGVVVNKQLTLEGAQAGIDARGRSGVPESVVLGVGKEDPAATPFQVAADDVVLDGFSLRLVEDGWGVYLHQDVSGTVVTNTIFDGRADQTRNYAYAGVGIVGADHTEISQNAFEGTSIGVGIGGLGPEDIAVESNTFSGVFRMLDLGGDAGVDGSDLFIADNESDGGISLIHATRVTILENDLVAYHSGGVEIMASHDLLIAGNLIANTANHGVAFFGADKQPSSDAFVIGNTLTGNKGAGVMIDERYGSSPGYEGILEVHLNRIVGNTYGAWSAEIDPDPIGSIGAEDNWWGCNLGPDAAGCDQAVGTVYTEPRLVLGLTASPATVAPLGQATLTADLSVDSDGVRQPPELIPPAPIRFASSGGQLSSATALLDQGIATDTLSAPSAEGVITATAALDNDSTSTAIAVRNQVSARFIPDTIAPALTGVSLSPRSFRVDEHGSAEQPVSIGARKGTHFRYTLSEDARVTFAIERRQTRKKRGRCRKTSGSSRRKHLCTRYRSVGTFAAQSKRGQNTRAFSGKIGSRSLKPGRYRATIRATDAAGNHSLSKRVGFTIVRR